MLTISSSETDPQKLAQAFRTIPVPGSLAGNMVVLNDSGLVPPALLPVATFISSFTRDVSLATGTQAITGLGFKPRAVIFLAGAVGGSNDNSIGIDDGTNHGALVNLNALAAGTFHISAVVSIRFVQSALNIYAGLIQSLDTDGFTISWTKTGSPTGTQTIFFLALR